MKILLNKRKKYSKELSKNKLKIFPGIKQLLKELKKNKYGHTVLSHNEHEGSDLDDKVTISIDPETGTPRADLSIWDTQQMKDLDKAGRRCRETGQTAGCARHFAQTPDRQPAKLSYQNRKD